MRNIFIIVFFLSMALPVTGQGPGEPLYTIDSEGWYITLDPDGSVFYSNDDDIEIDPEDNLAVLPSLDQDDLIVRLEIELSEQQQPNVFPTDPVLYLGIRFGTFLLISSVHNLLTAEGYVFSDVETITFGDLEFYTASFTTLNVATITTYAHVRDEYAVFFDIYHTEDTDIEPALALLETFELLISE